MRAFLVTIVYQVRRIVFFWSVIFGGFFRHTVQEMVLAFGGLTSIHDFARDQHAGP